MSETVADIVRSMRNGQLRENMHCGSYKMWDNLADRIEAAVKRMAVSTAEQWTEIARQGSELEKLREKNNKMRWVIRHLKTSMCEYCREARSEETCVDGCETLRMANEALEATHD